MKPITYKQVLDSTGSLQALELWQGDAFITISLAGGSPHRNGARWIEVKEVINQLQARAKKDAAENAARPIIGDTDENT